ncbi:MAG: glycosyltransferase [Candidatus Marinimicrobia bacterium]|nr:glycosyltransferase [Candidatus Neomarinimicrobiota bacterium]
MIDSNRYRFISIIVPCYNSKKTIKECVSSIVSQDYPEDSFEILIIDDGSNDGTRDILKEIGRGKNIKLFFHAENRGLAAARNTGIGNANGEILLFVDSDMILSERFLQKVNNLFARDDIIGVIGKRISHHTVKMDKYQRYRNEYKRIKNWSKPIPFYYFLFNLTAVRKEVIEEVGYFNETYKIWGGEDNDLAYRIYKKYPAGLYFNPELIGYHRHYKPLKNELENIYKFAMINLPMLVRGGEEMVKAYKLEYSTAYTGSNFLKAWVGRFLITGLVKKAGIFFYEISFYPLSNIFLKLLFANYLLRGFSKSANK